MFDKERGQRPRRSSGSSGGKGPGISHGLNQLLGEMVVSDNFWQRLVSDPNPVIDDPRFKLSPKEKDCITQSIEKIKKEGLGQSSFSIYVSGCLGISL